LKQPGRIIVWTASIDRNKSRLQGRRTSKSISVESPRLSEIEVAAKSLCLSFTSKPGVSKPRSHWEKTGYMLVDRKGQSRAEVYRAIAKQVAKQRQAKTA